SHSIGGPINNNVVILLERAAHFMARPHEQFKPWGLPSLGRLKPKEVTVEALLADGGPVEGSFVTATTRFDHRSGAPVNSLIVVSCRMEGTRYSFLFGIGGESHESIVGLEPGDQVSLERSGDEILVNRAPVRRFYRRTIDGLVDMAGAGWKRLTG
ncbi:MAG TPA: thiolase family protein, partial [Geobacteraceae bacterium]|nr:thiolase family protein [Geobacteraceae bacterium]